MSYIYRKIILDSVIVRFGCGLCIEANVSIYSSKWLYQETAFNTSRTVISFYDPQDDKLNYQIDPGLIDTQVNALLNHVIT